MVAASVLCPIFRPGGLDCTFAGLRGQTVKDFELILIDYRYEKRHAQVMDLASASGIQTIHVPEHRRNGPWAVVAAAWNTGFMLAQGRIILMMPDYAYVAPDWIERHLQFHQSSDPVIVLSPYTFFHLPTVVDLLGNPVEILPAEVAADLPPRVHTPPADTFGEITIFQEPFDPSWIPDLTPWPVDLQCMRTNPEKVRRTDPVSIHVHLRNESMPLATLLEMNGLDETLDRGKAMIDIEFGRRLDMRGCAVVSETENRCLILNPRTLFPTMPSNGPGRWDYKRCEAYGLGTKSSFAANPYRLAEMAPVLQWWRGPDQIPTGYLDILDEAYYR